MNNFDLYDEINDTNVNEAIAFLNKHRNNDVVLNIDSVGGDVFAGLRLCQTIQNHKGKVTAKCGVVVASIASVIALSCDNIVITKDTFFMVHQAWATMQGNADELKSTLSLLEQASDRIKEIVAEKSKNADEVAEWFKGDTWFGYQAILDNFKGVSLVNEVKTLTARAVASISKLNNKPDDLMKLVAKAKEPDKHSNHNIEYINSVLQKANAILNN